jgi:hypothetical protein
MFTNKIDVNLRITPTANRYVCHKSITFIMTAVDGWVGGGLNIYVCSHFNCAILHILIMKILSPLFIA